MRETKASVFSPLIIITNARCPTLWQRQNSFQHLSTPLFSYAQTEHALSAVQHELLSEVFLNIFTIVFFDGQFNHQLIRIQLISSMQVLRRHCECNKLDLLWYQYKEQSKGKTPDGANWLEESHSNSPILRAPSSDPLLQHLVLKSQLFLSSEIQHGQDQQSRSSSFH